MPEKREPAIIVRGVTKEYTLGAYSARTLQGDLQSWWARKRGKDDPNLRVNVDERLVGSRFMALNGIDLDIYKGEKVGIIGVNGAGKSTLLKLLSRITSPTAGDIDLYGRVSTMLEVGTGFHAELTGRENIYMNGSILGMKKSEIDARMEDIIEFSEVGEFIDTPVKRYSSGMFVKLAFAVAAHLNSDIMIMDEVLAVGDMAFQRKCLEKMQRAADDEGKTVLYVSHNMGTIRTLCDRCIVMDAGKIIYDGDVDRAIGLYMEHSLGENDVDMDLREKSRGGTKPSTDICMEHLRLLDKASPIYADGEDLRLRLTVRYEAESRSEAASRSEAERDGIIFRVTFRNETDVAIATHWAPPRKLVQGLNELEYTIPLDSVVKGNFFVSIGMYTLDELGRHVCHDHITRALRIELLGRPNWGTLAYGYVEI